MHKFRRALVALIFAMIIFFVGCFKSTDPNTAQQDEAAKISAALGLGAQALAEADKLCADYAETMRIAALGIDDPNARLEALQKSRTLNSACNAIAHDAGASLTLAQDAVDAYDDAAKGYVACAAQRGIDAIGAVSRLMTDAGAPIPPKLAYALDVLGPLLKIAGPVCIMPATPDAGVQDVGPPHFNDDAPAHMTIDFDTATSAAEGG